MHSAFQQDRYYMSRQVLALTGQIRLYAPDGQQVLYCYQKMFRLKEDIRAYSDDTCSQELLFIQARTMIDFSAAYDVIDSVYGVKIGTLRRKGWKSLLRDEWEVLDPQDFQIGVLREDNPNRALLRRFLAGRIVPQEYEIICGEKQVATLRQRFHILRYNMDIDFLPDTSHFLDRRLGIAAAVLLAIVEGRQNSYN